MASTHVATSTGVSSADVSRADSERSRAYLTEKNRLLTERVDELEAALERKSERIETLEAEVERLTDALAARDRETTRTRDEHTVAARDDENGSATSSVWSRLFGNGSE